MNYNAHSTPQPERSVYNEGVNQIIRLNNIWQQCRALSVKCDFYGWNLELEAAWRELSSDAMKINSNLKQKIKRINDAFINFYNNKQHSKVWQILTLKEQLLRSIQEGAGKGGKYSAEFEDILE